MTLAISITGNDLTDAELLLDELASRVRTPNGARSLADVAGGMFAARAVDLHRNFVHALAGPSHAGPVVAARPLVELAILIHWIAADPVRNFPAWVGHSEARDAKALRAMIEHLPGPPATRTAARRSSRRLTRRTPQLPRLAWSPGAPRETCGRASPR